MRSNWNQHKSIQNYTKQSKSIQIDTDRRKSSTTNQNQIKDVFSKIINDFGNLDLCVFSSGTYDPKLEQEINIKQNLFTSFNLYQNFSVN